MIGAGFFRIGLDSSISHTMGPMRAAHEFCEGSRADGLPDGVALVRVRLLSRGGPDVLASHSIVAACFSRLGSAPGSSPTTRSCCAPLDGESHRAGLRIDRSSRQVLTAGVLQSRC